MSADGPTSAWHPAMMPNSTADIAANSDPTKSENTHSPAPEVTTSSQPQVTLPPKPIDILENHSSGVDEWFPDYEAGSPWDPKDETRGQLQEQGQVQDVEAEPQPQSEELAPVGALHITEVSTVLPGQEESVPETPVISSRGPTHVSHESVFSNESFARTVSHQPWMDDEEPEWSLPRTDTDPFKFMPPNDRTNSFPAVPRLDHQQEEKVEPLPMNQAEDVINQVEHQSESLELEESSTSHVPNALQQDNFWGDGEEESGLPILGLVGGDLQGPEEEASDARYAEGMPLINHQDTEAAEGQADDQAHDPFSQDGNSAGEDFLDQIGGATNASGHHDFLPSQLERKSTSQVLTGLAGTDSRGAEAVLEGTLLEEEEDEERFDFTFEQEAIPAAKETVVTGENFPASESAGQKAQENRGEDLAAKWSEAFAGDDDDDFLLEDEPAAENKDGKTLDPSAFFSDDDEGFLEDTQEPSAPRPAQQPTSSSQTVHLQPTGASNRYLPPAATTQPTVTHPPNPYFPSASPALLPSQAPNALGQPTPVAANAYIQPPPQQPYGASIPRPEMSKTQSFVDKSKGGYHSPYDLPMEVVKPRKRQSLQQIPRGSSTPASAPAPPRRGTSMYAQGSPTIQGPPAQAPTPQVAPQMQSSGSSISPPSSNHSGQSPSLGTKPPQQLKAKASFFEDLPLSNKTRPASRTSNKSQPSPSHPGLNGPPHGSQPPPPSMPTPPQEPSVAGHPPTSYVPRLVPSDPMNPYVSLPPGTSSAPAVPPPGPSRYSSASSQAAIPNGAAPPPMSRYSPAPPSQRPTNYAPGVSATPPTMLPHQPRTSSPLAHFEVNHGRTKPAASNGEPPLLSSRSSSFEPRLNRVPSLPPTREVDEEDTVTHPPAGGPPHLPPAQSLAAEESRHGQPPFRNLQTPPPPALNSHNPNNLPPPKRKISYGPVTIATEIIPPPRSQTGSPGATYGLMSPIKPLEMVPRPLSAQGPLSPSIATVISPTGQVQTAVVPTRPRGMSQKLNLIPPTDGREHDPLQRWKGAPLISWGVNGMVVTSFPVDVPRYGMSQTGPMIVRSPGEVKIKSIKDIQPLEERLAKFPGPLRGKSKKKETISWLEAGIQELEKGSSNLAFETNMSHEDKRAVERVLLWKILKVFIDNDGTLEGSAKVDKAVRDVLSLVPTGQDDVASSIYATSSSIGGFAGESSATQMQSDSVDSGTVEKLKKALLVGDREKAVWDAADKRLWGHALLIANTVSPELYHKVSQEFIKKEVNFPGHNNEPLAALYAVLSGNHQESVDELVPMHARAGMQMVASSSGPATGGLEGLEKWRESLALILSNRSSGDVQALSSLGNLLSEYGRAEAAHICFLFARSVTVFGGLDDPQAQFVLLGADHRKQAQQFFKETEALLLSEVYEYGLLLTGAQTSANGVPHLAVYKLLHATTLAEYGFSDKALEYCDIILNNTSAQTKRSPYHHLLLESAVEDLRQRVVQAPNQGGSNSWISKPNMNKVSDSMWSRFNKFVAGEDTESNGQGSPKFGDDSGPFSRIAGGTPTISRPASVSNATGMEMFGSPNGYASGAPSLAPSASPQVTRTSSRYAPGVAASPYESNSAYAPNGRSSMERTSGEYNRRSYELQRPPSDVPAVLSSGYIPNNVQAPAQGYPDPGLGIAAQSSSQPALQPISTTTSAPLFTQTSVPRTPGFSPYTPFSQTSSPYAHAATTTSNASPYVPVVPTAKEANDDKAAPAMEYKSPSYGYEPPSMGAVEDQPAQATGEPASSGGYEPPSYQPYGYEPHSYQPDPETNNDNAEGDDEPKPKKKSLMDDNDDDYFTSKSSANPREKTREEKDREAAELFRKVAEEEAKRAEEEKAAKGKKGWGFGSWFGAGGSKKDSLESSPNKPIRAKLGEKSSFVYDPEQKRWVNKAAGAENNAPKVGTPPPPRATPRPAGSGTPPPPRPAASAPPPWTGSTPAPSEDGASPNLGGLTGPPAPPGSAPPPIMRTVSSASSAPGGGPLIAPPSRPSTSMSNASSIDDLLGAAVPRKGTASRNKKKGGGRYVDVMAK